jgi:hypothetical protein
MGQQQQEMDEFDRWGIYIVNSMAMTGRPKMD